MLDKKAVRGGEGRRTGQSGGGARLLAHQTSHAQAEHDSTRIEGSATADWTELTSPNSTPREVLLRSAEPFTSSLQLHLHNHPFLPRNPTSIRTFQSCLLFYSAARQPLPLAQCALSPPPRPDASLASPSSATLPILLKCRQPVLVAKLSDTQSPAIRVPRTIARPAGFALPASLMGLEKISC